MGDIWDAATALPMVSRFKDLGNLATGETVSRVINDFSPRYVSRYNARTGKFELTPRE
jgi:hypothetical protein